MNAAEMAKRSNSWHWLAAVAVLSAVASAFMPEYGWKDVLAYRSGRLEPMKRKQAERLAGLAALREEEAVLAEKQADGTRKNLARLKADFAAYGFEAVPRGEEAVFAAQSRVSGALAKRNIRIVSNEASVKKEPSATHAMPTIDYKASGDFRDIFMFFVGETHVRANYAFKDIAVSACDGEGMNLSFTLQVYHR